MHPADYVSPQLIDRFNAAAGLAREGDFEASLAAWDALLGPEPEADEGPPRLVSGRFMGVSRMRRAWVLMDLGRYEQARAQLEDGVLLACLGQLGPEELYEYFFSLGNTCGELGDVAAMDDALTRAMGLACEELGDRQRAVSAWLNFLVYAERGEAWERLARDAPRAVAFADHVGVPWLAERAQALLTRARLALG